MVDKKYELPSSMEFTFTVDKMMFHRGRGMGDNLDSGDSEKDDSEPTIGKVYLTYSNYKVNQGIPDEIFEKSEEKSD